MRSALVPSNIAHDEALEVRDAVPTTLVRWDRAYRCSYRCQALARAKAGPAENSCLSRSRAGFLASSG